MTGETGTRVAGWMMVAGIPLFLIGSGLFVLPLYLTQHGSFGDESALQGLAMLAGGGTIALAGLLVGVVGLALYVLIPALSGPQLAHRDYGSHRVVLACTFLAIVAGNLLAALYFIPAGFLSGTRRGFMEDVLSPGGIVIAALTLDVALLGVVYLRVVRPGVIDWHRMGIEGKDLHRRLLMGLGLGVVLLFASALLEMLMEQFGIKQTQTQIFEAVRGASLPEFVLVLFSGAVVAPAVEEVFFRGYVFRAYLDQKGPVSAFVFSAALFAIVHLNLAAFVPIFAMGLLLCLFYYRTGSIIPGIVAHAVNNTAAFLLLYLGLQ